jgi:hypothetical protein
MKSSSDTINRLEKVINEYKDALNYIDNNANNLNK